MSNWVSDGRTSSQSICRLFWVVVISHCLTVHAMVSACFRTRFEKDLRLLVKYSAMVGVFLHVLKELDTVLNLRLYVVELSGLRSMCGSPLVVVVGEPQLVFILNSTHITAVVVLRSLHSIPDNLTFHLPFRRRL